MTRLLTRVTIPLCGLVLAVWLAQAPQVHAGEPSANKPPELELPDLNGKTRRLADWRGKLLLVNFWASWCSSCQVEIPALMRYQKQYGAKGLQIIGVGLDEPVKLRNFRNTYGLNYPVLVADPERSAELLAVWGNYRGIVPYNVLLDAHGRILEVVTGVIDDDVMETLILPHLNPSSRMISHR